MKRKMSQRKLVKFKELTEKDWETGCWEWLGYKNPKGYAKFGKGKRGEQYAYRWAYEHWVSIIPEGLDLHHTCENPGCVNPFHLEPMTRSEHVAHHRKEERR